MTKNKAKYWHIVGFNSLFVDDKVAIKANKGIANYSCQNWHPEPRGGYSRNS